MPTAKENQLLQQEEPMENFIAINTAMLQNTTAATTFPISGRSCCLLDQDFSDNKTSEINLDQE
jgi:hypothetical protein